MSHTKQVMLVACGHQNWEGDSPMNGSKCPGYKFLQSVQFAICCTKHIQKISEAGSIYVINACPCLSKNKETNNHQSLYLKCLVKQTKQWQQQQQQHLTRNSNIGCLGIKCAQVSSENQVVLGCFLGWLVEIHSGIITENPTVHGWTPAPPGMYKPHEILTTST